MTPGDIQFSTYEAVVVAHISGEVDMSNAPDMATTIGSAATNEMTAVVLDLSDVEYLDSAGIHLVFTLRENLRARGQEMRLVVPGDSPVNDTLRLAGVSQLAPPSRDLAEALRDLGVEEGASQQ